MDRERAKELLPVIQAFAEGKTIQVFISCKDRWEDNNNPLWDANADKYRIKPEPKYRPFKDAEECWEEMQKHQPFSWIIDKKSKERSIIMSIYDGDDYNLKIFEPYYGFKRALDDFTFIDGTPFGKLEE